MIMRARFLWTALALLALVMVARADAPHVYAIVKARIVTAAGPPLAAGTIVIRNGRIEAVGASLGPPADAQVIDGTGLIVYPGLLDMGRADLLDVPTIAEPRELKTREELDRWWRSVILRPEVMAASYVKVDSPDSAKLATAGITTVLATPGGEAIRGHSALINVVARDEDPQIGDLAGPRRGQVVLRTPVALHVAFSGAPSRSRAYPESLMGVIAFVRQAFLDAQHDAAYRSHYEQTKGQATRPTDDPPLLAMRPAVEGRLPVAFEAQTEREIRRALKLAAELKLDPIITGARESSATVPELKAQNARVILSLNYPVKPRSLGPEAEEPLRTLRARADAPKTPAALEQGGVVYAFASAGLREPADLVKNAAKAVKAGLPAEAAVRALTINAARIAGVADRLGSIETGKIGNVIVTDGDLFEEKTAVKHMFIDGRPVNIPLLAGASK
jgi:imidazolonepropionase-like amidohydrolase